MLTSFFESPLNINRQEREALVQYLQAKDGVLFAPTDTVFGILCLSKQRIYDAKQKPTDYPLQILTTKQIGISLFSKKVSQNRVFTCLIETFWPGALSIISETTTGTRECIRVPNNIFLLDILHRLQKPIYASSLNPHGEKELWTRSAILKFAEALPFSVSVIFQKKPIRKASTIASLFCHDDHNQATLKINREGCLSARDILSALFPKFNIQNQEESLTYDISLKTIV